MIIIKGSKGMGEKRTFQPPERGRHSHPQLILLFPLRPHSLVSLLSVPNHLTFHLALFFFPLHDNVFLQNKQNISHYFSTSSFSFCHFFSYYECEYKCNLKITLTRNSTKTLLKHLLKLTLKTDKLTSFISVIPVTGPFSSLSNTETDWTLRERRRQLNTTYNLNMTFLLKCLQKGERLAKKENHTYKSTYGYNPDVGTRGEKL